MARYLSFDLGTQGLTAIAIEVEGSHREIVRAVPAPLAYRWLGEHWRRATRGVGVRLRMYDLRHLSARFAGNHGARDRDLAAHLGHANRRCHIGTAGAQWRGVWRGR